MECQAPSGLVPGPGPAAIIAPSLPVLRSRRGESLPAIEPGQSDHCATCLEGNGRCAASRRLAFMWAEGEEGWRIGDSAAGDASFIARNVLDHCPAARR